MIGRTKEIQQLKEILDSNTAQFLALTGRRRVGKTFLVREFFKEKIQYMEVVGKKSASKQESIDLFLESLNSCFNLPVEINSLTSWKLAFKAFSEALAIYKKPIVLFLDELPWLAGRDPELLSELDHFWNTKWGQVNNFKLVVCGSATSWILDNIINNKGGLHNRLTAMLHLKPFTLKEVREYLELKKIKLNNQQIITLYLCIGGVPYYLDWIKKNKSVPQIIQELCFSENGRLSSEYDSLLDSLFIKSNMYGDILKSLAEKRYGLTLKEISERTGIKQGGTLNILLKELESCHFIKKYYPYGHTSRNSYYRLIDEFVMFHYKWIIPFKKNTFVSEEDYWLKRFNTPEFYSWAGYNFETLCHKHIDCILKSLGISGIKNNISHWNQKVNPELGLKKSRYQIDLIIERADDVINLCEIKYTSGPLVVDKTLLNEITEKQVAFEKTNKIKKQLTSVLISASQVLGNTAPEVIGGIVLGDELFY